MSEVYAQPLCRGIGDSMYTRKAYATRETPRRGQRCPTGRPRGTGWAPWGVGEVRSTAEAGVMPVEGRDLSSRRTQHVVRDLEIGEPINSEECSETAEGVARESEGRSRYRTVIRISLV